MITTIKEQWASHTDTTLTGYLVDSNKSVPLAEGNRDYQECLRAIAGTDEYEDNAIVPSVAYTPLEILQWEDTQDVAQAKQNIDKTNVTMTIDMFQLLSPSEQTAMEEFRAKNLAMINGTEPVMPMLSPALQVIVDKFN